MLQTADLPDAGIADLVKKTESTMGLVLGRDEQPAAYFARLDAARKEIRAAPSLASGRRSR